MGSLHYRIRGIDLAARCCHGVFYAVGFLTTTLIFMAMLWILWCYFGLALVHMSDGQRRAVVHYSLPSQDSPTSSPVLPNQGEDALKSISKSVTTSSSFQRGSSRGESQLKSGTERTDWSGGGNTSLAKGDFAARDRIASGAKDPSIASASPNDEDDGFQVRRVPSSYDNRHDFSESSKDKNARRTGVIENANVQNPPNLTSDAKSLGAFNISRNITSSREYPHAERKDEIQSSRSSDVGGTHHDLASGIDSPHSPDRTRIAEDDNRGSRGRYDPKYRGRDKGVDTDDSYSKGDTRLQHDHGKTADDSHQGDEKIHLHGRGSHTDNPDEPPRRRGDDDRYTDYDDTYKSHGDRPYYRDDRYKTYEGRQRMRDDERDTSRVDDRYRTRDMDRSRADDRYITRDEDEDRISHEDRYRDDDRDRYRDEGRSRTRYRDGDRSRYGDNYRSRVGYRDRNTEDFVPERGSQNTRYSDRDGYHTRGDDDRYRDDSRTKERDYRDPVMSSRDDAEDYPPRGSGIGNSNLEVPSRTVSSESRYRVTERDDGYKRPTRYDDQDRISPTRVRDDSYSSRPTLMDSRSRSEITRPDSRRMDDDRFSQGSKRYEDDSRKEYRTRMPNENTKYAPRYGDDLAVDRRSYDSEKDDEYTSRTRYYDDRRYYRDRDEEYPRRSRPDDDDEEYSSRRTDDDEEYPRRRTSVDEEYPRRRTDDEEDFRRSSSRGNYDTSRTRHRDDRYKEYSRDDDRYEDDRTLRRYDNRPRRQDGDLRKAVVSDSSTGEIPFRGSEEADGRDTPKRIAPDSSRRDDADGSLTVERPLSAKDVIEAALKQSDLNDKNPVRKVSYPVFDPRVSNLTSPEIIRPSERRGITIHSRKKRWVKV